MAGSRKICTAIFILTEQIARVSKQSTHHHECSYPHGDNCPPKVSRWMCCWFKGGTGVWFSDSVILDDPEVQGRRASTFLHESNNDLSPTCFFLNSTLYPTGHDKISCKPPNFGPWQRNLVPTCIRVCQRI
jgi:hypothetical protein